MTLHSKKIIAYGFSFWKQKFIGRFFPDFSIVFVNNLEIIKYLFEYNYLTIICWGMKNYYYLSLLKRIRTISIIYLEDGFIRSKGLGVLKNEPISLLKDTQRLHFDANGASDLEDLLNNYKPSQQELNLAQHAINLIKISKVTKYNIKLNDFILDENAVLVVAQLEGDLSIKYSTFKKIGLFDLLLLAITENPGRKIYIKPHPEMGKISKKILKKLYRSAINNKDIISSLIYFLPNNVDVTNSLNKIYRVYTISSLFGFESLMYDAKVTCLGSPFYSGWGLTDDRQYISRRKRRLTFLEMFYISYILYPMYFSPDGHKISIIDAIDIVARPQKYNN